MERVVNDGVPNPAPNGRVRRSERRIIAAATELFCADGYQATTLAAVAVAADVAERTVYVRFGTKAALFKRVGDVAIAGDVAAADVLGRDWMQTAMTAKSRTARIEAMAGAVGQIMQRAGTFFAVAQEAAAIEPVIAAFWQEGREATLHIQRLFWTKMRDDRLLPESVDLDHAIHTSAVLAAAETYLLTTHLYGWDLDEYEAWLRTTYMTLAAPRRAG